MRLVKRLLILIALLAPLFAHAANPNSTLIGKWSGVDSEGIKGGFSFNADGSAEMIAGSDVYNETSEYKLMWETETDSKPMRIILTMKFRYMIFLPGEWDIQSHVLQLEEEI